MRPERAGRMARGRRPVKHPRPFVAVTGGPAYVPHMSPQLMTAEELLQTSIPNKRTELVRGHLVVREAPGGRHGSVTALLAVRPGNHSDLTGGRTPFIGETGLTVARNPDPVGG